MSQQNINLNFHGFHPSDFTQAYLSDKMTRLHEESPYGANLEAEFSRQDRLFKGVVTIRSRAGRFFAVASGTKLKDVTHRLSDQIKHQLNRWKAQRFQPDRFNNREVTYETEIETSA